MASEWKKVGQVTQSEHQWCANRGAPNLHCRVGEVNRAPENWWLEKGLQGPKFILGASHFCAAKDGNHNTNGTTSSVACLMHRAFACAPPPPPPKRNITHAGNGAGFAILRIYAERPGTGCVCGFSGCNHEAADELYGCCSRGMHMGQLTCICHVVRKGPDPTKQAQHTMRSLSTRAGHGAGMGGDPVPIRIRLMISEIKGEPRE